METSGRRRSGGTVNILRRQVLSDELIRVQKATASLQQAHENTLSAIKAIGIILGAVLLGLIILYQRRQSRKAQMRIRHRIQQDLHDEIGSQLSAISVAINLNQKLPELPPKANIYMATASQCARRSYRIPPGGYLADRQGNPHPRPVLRGHEKPGTENG